MGTLIIGTIFNGVFIPQQDDINGVVAIYGGWTKLKENSLIKLKFMFISIGIVIGLLSSLVVFSYFL